MRSFPFLRDGDVLEPRHLNVIYAELERLGRMSYDGLEYDDGQAPRLSVPLLESDRLAKVATGGVSALTTSPSIVFGTGNARIYNPEPWNEPPTWVARGADEAIYNAYFTASIAVNKWVVVRRLWNRWVIIGANC